MIFVTLGTQKFQFDRLLKELDNLINQGKIKKEDLVVQCPYKEYEPKNFETFKLKPQSEINKMNEDADIIIMHCGTGSIIRALKMGKKVILVPRRKEYKEHVDNHQLELAKVFEEKYGVLVVNNIDELYKCILKCNDYKPREWKENNSRLINSIQEKIDALL